MQQELIPAQPATLPTIVDLATEVGEIVTKVKDIEAQVARAQITDIESFNRGSDFLTIITTEAASTEAARKRIKAPIDEAAKAVQSVFVPLTDRLESAKKDLKAKMLKWKQEKDRADAEAAAKIRREQEEAALALAKQQEDKGNTEVAEAIIDMASKPIPKAAPLPTNSYGRSTGTVATWKGEVHTPFDVLNAVLTGQIPISVLEFKTVELNKIAASKKVEGIYLGIKITKVEDLKQR